MSAARRQLVAGAGWWCLLVVCAWLYWPGLQGPFILDDGVNLRHLGSLDDSSAYLGDIVSGNTSGPLGRPVSMLSFAATYAVGGPSPFTFKMHNLALHLITACTVHWFAFLVARRRALPAPVAFSCGVAALWLLSPLFVSTVLYAVQRMTQLTTLFMLGALVAYCKGRDAWVIRRPLAVLSMVMTVAFIVLAVLSKENGVLVIPLILLTELGIYRPTAPSTRYVRGERIVLTGLLLAGLGVFLVLLVGYGPTFLDYSRRDFSMSERLLTQARVLWDYSFGFTVPVDRGYGLMHDDIEVSRGIFTPKSTAVALAALLAVAIWSTWELITGRRNVAAYGILFFLVGHSVESTIVPLELHFEHRNYLPAAGLAIALVHTLLSLGHRAATLRLPVRLALLGLLAAASISLGVQATWWSNAYLMAIRGIEEHPRSQRANAAIAVVLAEAGFPAEAVRFNDRGVELGGLNEATRELRRLGLYCMGRKQTPAAILDSLASHLDQLDHVSANEALQIVTTHIVDGRCDALSSRKFADIVYAGFVDGLRLTTTVAASMAKVENVLGRYDQALVYTRYLLARDPADVIANLMSVYFSWQLADEPALKSSLEQLRRLQCHGKLRREDVEVYRTFADAAKQRGIELYNQDCESSHWRSR